MAIKDHNKDLKEEQKYQKQLQKELKKKEKEKYIENRYKKVDLLNKDIQTYVNNLESIISNINTHNHISIEEFIKMDIEKIQLPKGLLIENDKPSKPSIRQSSIFEKIFKPYKLKYDIYVDEVNDKYKNELELYEKKELKRKSEIKSLQKAHELKVDEIISNKKSLYINGDANFITSYKIDVLNKSKYPFEFNKVIDIGYCKEFKKIVVDYLLPKKDIVNEILRYEYKPRLDEIREVYRKSKDINNIYNEVIYSIVLKSIYDIFSVDIYNSVDSIVFNGYIEDIDLSTGQDIKPCIISAMVDNSSFENIDVTRVDKLKCLRESMQARINITSDLEFRSVVPIHKLDYLSKCVIDGDSINLLEVNPYELESLVCTLFRNMGYEVEETKMSHDGGIDCRLYNNDPILGGKVIGQVKRYKNNIDIPKIREFESVLRNSDAMKGIFISTSDFSSGCRKFSDENNITLINGDELVKYFNEYGISSYINIK